MRNHCVCEVALEDQRDALCALFAAGSEPRWKGDEFTVDVRKCAKCRNPIKVTKRVTANGMNQTKAAAEAALWSAVWDKHGSCTETSATATSGDAGSSGGSSSGAHADAAGEADFPAVTTVHGSPIAARTGGASQHAQRHGSRRLRPHFAIGAKGQKSYGTRELLLAPLLLTLLLAPRLLLAPLALQLVRRRKRRHHHQRLHRRR